MGSDAAPLWTSAAQAVPVVVAAVYFAVITVALTVIDVRTHRLPNRIVLPSYLVAIGCFLTAGIVGGSWERFVSALVGMGGLFLFYLALRALSRSGIGGGDVKLAGLVGLHLGWLGLTPLIVGAIAAFLLGGAYAAVLLISRRATRSTRIPFGPFMLAGAWVAIVFGISYGAWAGMRAG